MRRACLQEAHLPGHPSLAGLGPGCGPTAPTSCSMRQKARDDLPPAPSIHVSLSLEVALPRALRTLKSFAMDALRVTGAAQTGC